MSSPSAAGLILARVVLMAAALTVAAASLSVAQAGARPSMQQVTEGLTCQCGCGLTVANCNHPDCSFSVPLRAEIAGMMDKGMGAVEITAFFRNKYGEKILSSPTAEGFNLLAWTAPFIALALGAAFILLIAGRWHRAGSPTIGGQARPGPSGGFDPALRRELEDELKEST